MAVGTKQTTFHTPASLKLLDEDIVSRHDYLHEIGYGWKEVSDDPAYRLFLAS
ncbi:hypothetical protein [Aeromonas allosaccharophila]|uniref:hypothetical protein n=1 Tax=Aeromonas allosaccharophila TaxID=656 RepID=UPI0034263BA1